MRRTPTCRRLHTPQKDNRQTAAGGCESGRGRSALRPGRGGHATTDVGPTRHMQMPVANHAEGGFEFECVGRPVRCARGRHQHSASNLRRISHLKLTAHRSKIDARRSKLKLEAAATRCILYSLLVPRGSARPAGTLRDTQWSVLQHAICSVRHAGLQPSPIFGRFRAQCSRRRLICGASPQILAPLANTRTAHTRTAHRRLTFSLYHREPGRPRRLH